MKFRISFVAAILTLLCSISNLRSIIPHPDVINRTLPIESAHSEIFGLAENSERDEVNLPRNVLIFMVEFNDIHFSDTISNQDYLDNPDYEVSDYIGRFMYHLQSYYLDVSSGNYRFEYTVLDSIIRLPNTISYYGEREKSLVKRVELIEDTISAAEAFVDFSLYDAFIIFHSGSGRETDIYGTNPNSISSSFINRNLLQHVLDPENDDFPGIETSDGLFIKEVIIAASNQDHPDNPEDLNYGILGLLCHLYGRQIGLPALFGNVSSLGRAAGAGNFCLMGTGIWNANGFVPPFLSAWLRTYMGWGDAVLIDSSANNLSLTYPFAPFSSSGVHKIYKIPFSQDEYFLIENRQQNPDNSTLGGQPSFTFQLLPEGEQDYYKPPFNMVPRFNFMKNSYRGCEWDFYLPGYGGPDTQNLIDGSGILIWHIDKNVIAENLENNTINANPAHQGVTLMEADGIQHLRSGIPDLYMRGSPYDAFRKGHNDYFGKQVRDDGSISLPYVKSYYGKADVEIHSISEASNVMTFSVTYPWSLEYENPDNSPLPITVFSDEQDDDYLFIAHKSGSVFLFKNEALLSGYPISTPSIPHLYAVTKDKIFLVPVEDNDEQAGYYLISANDWYAYENLFSGYSWATHPVVIDNGILPNRAVLGLNQNDTPSGMIVVLDEDFQAAGSFELNGFTIVSNLVLRNTEILFVVQDSQQQFILQVIDLTDFAERSQSLDLPAETEISSLTVAPITGERMTADTYRDNLLIIGQNGEVFLVYEDGTFAKGFPRFLPVQSYSPPSLADISGNGFLDILLAGDNGLYALGYNGELLSYPMPTELPYPSESITKPGIVSLSTEPSDKPAIFANIAANRLVSWNSNLELSKNYPLVMPHRLIHNPHLHLSSRAVSLYLLTDSGFVYRTDLIYPDEIDLGKGWFYEYGNLERTSYFNYPLTDNHLEDKNRVFIRDECYVFPNPISWQNGGVGYFNIMVTDDVSVEAKIFDISGKVIFRETYACQAYMRNRDKIKLDVSRLANGVYFVLLKAKGEVVELRFAVEK